MKRILAVATFAVAACVGFNSAASAQSATSTQTGVVVPTCSITSDGNQNFTAIKTPINGVDFPTTLKSTGVFSTLCNTGSSKIDLSGNGTSYPTAADPSVGYYVTGSSSVYTNIPSGPVSIAATPTITAAHGYLDTPAKLTVSPYVAAKEGKILQDGTYTVVINATITP